MSKHDALSPAQQPCQHLIFLVSALVAAISYFLHVPKSILLFFFIPHPPQAQISENLSSFFLHCALNPASYHELHPLQIQLWLRKLYQLTQLDDSQPRRITAVLLYKSDHVTPLFKILNYLPN